jgi:hypothetical protein
MKGQFETEEWYLETKDGQKLVLLDGAQMVPKSEWNQKEHPYVDSARVQKLSACIIAV